MRGYNYLALAVMLLAGACEEEGGESLMTEDDPSELSFSVNVSDTDSGRVDVMATANNAVSYELITNVRTHSSSLTGDTLTSSDGNFTVVYTTEIEEEIFVRAFGPSGRFVSGSQEIVVEWPELEGNDPVDDSNNDIDPDGTLIWHDEFDGTSLNLDDWTFEIGTGSNGWGNQELQYYLEDNVTVADGFLTIEARKETHSTSNYTSSRIKTQGKQSFQYGRMEIRAKLPQGQGIWPAIWMLGESFSTKGWPACGEIDIIELVGGSDSNDEVHGTLHWGDENTSNHVQAGNDFELSSGIFADDFHVFSIEWDETNIRWFVDGVQFGIINITPEGLNEFHDEFFFILNVAVGGLWPGSPDSSTSFPQQMVVDYIRVYELED